MDQLTPSHPDVRWHSADLNAGWLSPTGYYWIPEAWGHTSSDASGGGPCKHATSIALAADLTRTWGVAISGTVPDGQGVAASLPLQYGAHRPWVHTVDAQVTIHLLRHADRERTTGVPAGAAKMVNQMPLRWLLDSLCARGQHAGHPFWYVRATSHHSDALLHKADWAASQDTVLQNTPPDPGHAQRIVAGRDGHLDLRPPTMRVLGEVAQLVHGGEALVLQTAGYQAILHGHAGGYRSHILAGGRWTVWHSTARQGASPPLPQVDWQQGPTQAYYMSADPWPLAVLLYTVSAPNKRQEPGGVNAPALVWSPDQEEHLRAAWQGDAIRAADVPDLHAGPITHARPAATLAVAQQGQQNPQWLVCMFSPADAHIVVCDPERLPGPEAVIRVADCTRMIVKALQEGEHHALLLQVRLKDNARAARPGVWPAAAHPADLELQLAVPTTVYHWLLAFHDLRCRGKPDRQIGSTHWQTWLQADAQRDAIRGLGPAPATRSLDAASPGHTLAPHTVPLANLPFEPAAEGAIRKSVPLPPARGATEPTKCPLCADKYYTSGAMLEHLAWHTVHAAAPGGATPWSTSSTPPARGTPA